MQRHKRCAKHSKRPSKLERFYRSDEWHLARAIKICNQNGLCEKCGKPGNEVHHKIHLTIQNVDDPNVSLNSTAVTWHLGRLRFAIRMVMREMWEARERGPCHLTTEDDPNSLNQTTSCSFRLHNKEHHRADWPSTTSTARETSCPENRNDRPRSRIFSDFGSTVRPHLRNAWGRFFKIWNFLGNEIRALRGSFLLGLANSPTRGT
jgi:hypothetical protein